MTAHADLYAAYVDAQERQHEQFYIPITLPPSFVWELLDEHAAIRDQLDTYRRGQPRLDE